LTELLITMSIFVYSLMMLMLQ